MKSDLKPDTLVGVILKGHPLIGRLLSCKGSKAVVSFGGERRDQEMPLRELMALRSAEEFSQREGLPSPDQIQALQLCPRTAAEVWWLLSTDGEFGPDSDGLTVESLTDLLFEKPGLVQLGAVWSWVHGDQDWFKLRRDRTLQPRNLDDIRRRRQERCRERLRQSKEQHQRDLLRDEHPLNSERLEQLDSSVQGLLEDLIELVQGAEPIEPSPAEMSLLDQLELKPERRSIRQWLIQKELLDPARPAMLRGSVWSQHFSEELEAEAERLLALSVGDCAGDDSRIDLTHQVVYTLDDASTREIDDGLALERRGDEVWIWIHIADPSRLILPGSPLDREACRRATSLYLADGVQPMIPMALASEGLSLRAGQRSAALSVGVRLDDSGAVIDERLHRSWVCPRYGLTYEDGDELIELAPPGDEDLADLDALMRRRFQWRRQRGAVHFDRPEGRFRRGVSGPELQVIDPSPSRQMVSEAMLLMGAVVAEFGRTHNLALPFRSQPAAELPEPSVLDRIPEGPARDAAIKRCLSRGLQGTSPLPHFSLGLDAYVQATSPIRRYADLIAHRQLIGWMQGESVQPEETIREQLDALDGPLRQSIQISREDQRHWQQVWLDQHRDQRWNVLFLRWLRPQDKLALVHVPDLAMDLVGHARGSDPNPGDPLEMEVIHVDPDHGELQLQFL